VLHQRPNTFAQTCLLALSYFLAVERRTIHIRTVARWAAIVGECIGNLARTRSPMGESAYPYVVTGQF
jgi:hypothetical protein